jgi:hypothetical protein
LPCNLYHSLIFIESIIAAFLAWTACATLCVASDEFLAKDPQKIVNVMAVTHIHVTPTLASHLDPQSVPKLEYLVISGEPLKAKLQRDWAGKNLLYHGISSPRQSSDHHTCTDTSFSRFYRSRDRWSLYHTGEDRDVQRNHRGW